MTDLTGHDPGDEDRRPGPPYCRNCGSSWDVDESENFGRSLRDWRPCPNPSPGRPLVDCGVGGHMYTDPLPELS